MEQFSLEKYLENPSRKVVTRRGNPVRIICTDRKHGKDDLPIVFLEENNGGEFLLTCRNDGRCDNYDTQYDLFFADKGDKSQSIEIPFGAKDSEFIKDEYYIPEGCEARIEGNKVIIEKIQKEEELTEFEKELNRIVQAFVDAHCYLDKVEIHHYAKTLLDLARKELNLVDNTCGEYALNEAYKQGKQDALKDLPKWKKVPKTWNIEDNQKVVFSEDYKYYIDKKELFNKLPKE